MLVLSAPLAIVVGYFFLNMFSENQTVAANIEKLKKIIIIVLLLIGILAYSFLVVFLAHKQRIWLLFISATGFILYLRLMKQRKGVFYPFLLGGFLLWINAQTSLLTEAGLTPHATLQKFAQTINAHKQNDEVVGVGSNDIHEKEFQVFFDQLVIKAANDETEETRQTLKELFNTPKGVYCLITAKDFYAPLVPPEYHFDIIEEEYMIRKRMAIDKGFFVAVLKFDRQKVRDYLMEKILLIKKS